MTNKQLYDLMLGGSTTVMDDYPCDIGGSNQSIEYHIEHEGKEYYISADRETKKVNFPNKKAIPLSEPKGRCKACGIEYDYTEGHSCWEGRSGL